MLRRTEPALIKKITHGLQIRGLSKSFGTTTVLNGIDLDMSKGELIAVLGPSGSGKTTLLRLICGFEHADAGSIKLGGRLVSRNGGLHIPPEKRGIGYVAQEGALFPHLSVEDNVLFGLPRPIRRARRKQRTRRAGDLLELVGLPAHYGARKPAALSGGEQQRVALARALAPNPAIVLLDEPFSALDAGLRADLRADIAASLKKVNATALLVTHDQNEALSIADRVAVLQKGRFGQIATPKALYERPANSDIARFVGDAVLVPGQAQDGTVECCFGRLPLAQPLSNQATPLAGAVEVMIRPEQFRLCPPPTQPHDNETFTASVEQVVFYGHDTRLDLRLSNGQKFMTTLLGMDIPEPGRQVGFRVNGNVIAYPR